MILHPMSTLLINQVNAMEAEDFTQNLTANTFITS